MSFGAVFDASGNDLNIVRTLSLSVIIGAMSCQKHQMQVVNTSSRNVILGRDFMSQFHSTTFHWERSEVEIDGHIVKGVTIEKKTCVTLVERVTIPARTEQIVEARCHKRIALLNVDFDPVNLYLEFLEYIRVMRA